MFAHANRFPGCTENGKQKTTLAASENMQTARRPHNDTARLHSLGEYRLLDTPPETVFDGITAVAAQLAGVPISLISLVDQDRQWFKSSHGLPGVGQTPRDVAFCAHAILQAEPFIVADALNDSRFADNPLVSREPRIRFYAGMPLINRRGHGVGTLCVIDRVPRELSSGQIDSLRRLADVVLALFEARTDHDRLAAGQQALVQSEQRLRTLIDASPALISYIDRSERYLLVNQTYEHWFGKPREQVIGLTMRELLGDEAHQRAKEPFERALRGETVTFENYAIGKEKRHVQSSFVPDVGAGGVQGVFVLASDISSRVADELRRQNETLRAMSAKLRADIEAEQKRIAYALHDQMGQDLTVLRVHVSRILRRWSDDDALTGIVRQMGDILDNTGTSIRRIIADLRPLALDDFGVGVAAKILAHEIEEASGVCIDFTTEGEFKDLPENYHTSLYRMLQECLTNVVKHAHATEVAVRLMKSADEVRLTVADDGRGFAESPQAAPGHYGLLSIQERAEQLGGHVAVSSAPGHGTKVTIAVPVPVSSLDGDRANVEYKIHRVSPFG